jgi:hypothetical protein
MTRFGDRDEVIDVASALDAFDARQHGVGHRVAECSHAAGELASRQPRSVWRISMVRAARIPAGPFSNERAGMTPIEASIRRFG